MYMYILSIVLIVASNIIYNITQKSTPQKANPFAALLATYLTAAVLAFIGLLISKDQKSLIHSFENINWTSIALGVSIVGLEFGYLMAYRAGWDISIGSLVANISLAALLIPIGIFIYKESFSITKVFGALLCISGLLLINKK
jgi:drug/metabolite transporter (DMT)-like permease